jgi:phage gpG-like protein
MGGVRITGDLKKLERKLKALREPQLRRVASSIGEQLVSSTIRRFNDQRDPDGNAWKPHASATVRAGLSKKSFTKFGTLRKPARRKLEGRKILIQSARLRNSISSKVSGTSVAVGTNVIYARVHQLGGTKGTTGKLKVNIPARPFLGINAEDQAEIKRMLERHVGDL